jgi:hypothetical protein
MSAPTAPPTGLLLRPGLPVLRRDSTTLQVGLHPPLACRLEDSPDVRALLAALRDGTGLGELTAPAARALDILLTAGLVFPGTPGTPGSPGPGTPGIEAVRAQYGADGARRLAARATVRIGLRADPRSLRLLTELVEEAGLVVDDVAPAVWLVIGSGPLARESLDPLIRSATPHLLVAGDAAGRRIGPFVEPGRTACLRCVDAHEAESDPRRPFLVEQAALAADVTAPVDPVLERIVLAWAVRDLCRYVEGDEPSTWSTTVDLGPSGAPQVVRRLRHPHCGCAWDLLLDL